MKAVGIKELKNQLSRYLKMVRAGEFIYVMDRDEIIAELHQPTFPVKSKLSPWEQFLNQAEKDQALVKAQASEEGKPLNLKKLKPWPKKLSLKPILKQVREDRFSDAQLF
ncbi:MAG: hypothetical protein KDK66_02470 [Deltaproteobacteria bacterium]|nr:hypothetical protein [Deltaproteobacteria bacterium]